MKIARTLSIILVAATLPLPPVFAASKTVTLDVQKMKCATCPITIKKALSKVNGVSKINVSLEKKEVVVSFDDTQTNAAALVEATTNAGFPSHIKEARQ
jgi:mercuric ion binding protein